MRVLAASLGRYVGAAPVAIRIIVGTLMLVHGLDKIGRGPAGFGQFLGEQLGLPAGLLLGWLVTLLELVGGAMLIAGLFSRLIALLMTGELIGAILLVTGESGLIGQESVGFERDLAYIAGFIAVILLGPGRPSVDHLVGFETSSPVLQSGASQARDRF